MFLLPGAPQHVVEDLKKIGRQAALLKYNTRDLVRDLERVLGNLRKGLGLKTGTVLHVILVLLSDVFVS